MNDKRNNRRKIPLHIPRHIPLPRITGIFYPRKLTALLLVLVLTGASVANTACQKLTTASSMQLMKTEGSVGIADGKGKTIEPAERLNLYSGYRMATETESYAWIDLDSVKLAKMDSESRIEIQKSGKKLEILLNDGGLFFHVSEPLKDDETMEIRTSSMMVGIRGTCGWVETDDPDHMRVYILEGTVECTVMNPETDSGKSAYISGGEMAELTAYSGDEDGEIIVRDFSPSDIPDYILEEVLEDDDLLDKILSDSHMDLLNPEEPQEEQEDFNQEEFNREEEQETAEEENGDVENDGPAEEIPEGLRDAYWEIITQTTTTAFEKYPDRLDRHPTLPPVAAYYLHDINKDGIPELITTTSGSTDVLYSYYTYSQTQGIIPVGEDWRSVRSSIYVVEDQFIVAEYERSNENPGTYQSNCYLVTLPEDQIVIQYWMTDEPDDSDLIDWAYDDDPSVLDQWGAPPAGGGGFFMKRLEEEFRELKTHKNS